MVSALLVAVLVVGGFDFGGQVAGVYPVGGLGRFHSSSALLGGNVGYSTGPVRLEFGYRYTGLPGLQRNSYQLSLHQLALSGGYGFLRQPDWGFEAVLGLGLTFAERTFGSGKERGKVGTGELGIYFVQQAGKSRLSVGLAHTLFLENSQGITSDIAINQLFSIRAGVAYVP